MTSAWSLTLTVGTEVKFDQTVHVTVDDKCKVCLQRFNIPTRVHRSHLLSLFIMCTLMICKGSCLHRMRLVSAVRVVRAGWERCHNNVPRGDVQRTDQGRSVRVETCFETSHARTIRRWHV